VAPICLLRLHSLSSPRPCRIHKLVDKGSFLSMYNEARRETLTFEIISGAFAKCGISTYDLDVIT
jgi:hypothetical protein